MKETLLDKVDFCSLDDLHGVLVDVMRIMEQIELPISAVGGRLTDDAYVCCMELRYMVFEAMRKQVFEAMRKQVFEAMRKRVIEDNEAKGLQEG